MSELVAVISGSRNDRTTVEPVLEGFKELPIQLEYYVSSAHRSPNHLKELIATLEERDVKIIIGVAGLAAHLPGVIASMTLVPVYGVPLAASELQGLESLYSIVMMPGGIPVASFGLGKHGLKNAILMASAHLASSNVELKKYLTEFRQKQSQMPSEPLWANA